MLHAFNYMVVTYGYFNLQSWDKDHCLQNEHQSTKMTQKYLNSSFDKELVDWSFHNQVITLLKHHKIFMKCVICTKFLMALY